MKEQMRPARYSGGRPLHVGERELIRTLLHGRYPKTELDERLERSVVEDMQDGGMGSIRFLILGQSDRVFGETVAQAEYTDEDGVLVSIAINNDDRGELYEVDFWKVDFSPLRRYRAPSEVKLQEILGHQGPDSEIFRP
jgi:hypothetical protein